MTVTLMQAIITIVSICATSAETILTLKNRESIHFAKFVRDTCADTFFEELIHSMSLFLERFGTFWSAKVVKFVL